jgi:hypothetical protein
MYTADHWPRGLRHELSRPLKHWDHGFESHLRHGGLCAFILCLAVLCAGSGMTTGCYPVQGVLPTV